MASTDIANVVDTIAAAGFRRSSSGWTQRGQRVHALDVQDAVVFALKAAHMRPTIRAVEDVKRELARVAPDDLPADQAPAPTSASLSMEAALMLWRFSMYTLRRERSGWVLDGRPLAFDSLRKMASGWARVTAEANGLSADFAPDTQSVLRDLRKLVRDAQPR